MFQSCEKKRNRLISNLCQENVQLAGDIDLQRMMIENSAETVKVVSGFYAQTFSEILQQGGLDISSLQSVKYAISPERLSDVGRQIQKLYYLQEIIG